MRAYLNTRIRWEVLGLATDEKPRASSRKIGTRKGADVTNSLKYPLRSFLNSFLIPSWRAVRSYRPHLEEMDPIWGDDWSHSPSSDCLLAEVFWVFLRQMPVDLCTAPRIISLSSLSYSDRRDWRDTRGKWPLARNLDKSWWHRHNRLKHFWPQSKHGQQGSWCHCTLG